MFLPSSTQLLAVAFFLTISSVHFLHAHGAYHELVERIEAELKKSPADAALHFKLAEAHAGHEEAKACLKEIAEVERLAPGVYPTGYLRGFSLFQSGIPSRLLS